MQTEETCPESYARCQEHSTAPLIRLTFSEWFDWDDDDMCEDTEMDRWNSAAPPQWRMCYWLGGYTLCRTSAQWEYEMGCPSEARSN